MVEVVRRMGGDEMVKRNALEAMGGVVRRMDDEE
jgi:hypothetical protein